MKATEKAWIELGYAIFAHQGPNALKVEQMAKQLNKNKSSFYHLFHDAETFIHKLLDFHLVQAKSLIAKEAQASNEASLIATILAHKTDLLFNRQLRVYRENPIFEALLKQIDQLSLPALLPVWKNTIGLADDSYLAEMVLVLSLENFYLQITDKTLQETWLKAYFKGIRTMIAQFKLQKT